MKDLIKNIEAMLNFVKQLRVFKQILKELVTDIRTEEFKYLEWFFYLVQVLTIIFDVYC